MKGSHAIWAFVQVQRAAADSKVSVFGHASVALTIEASRLFLAEEWARTIPNPLSFLGHRVRRELELK